MGLFQALNLSDEATIDWEMTPEYTFGTFESWGGKERVRSKDERVYYFFVDAWEEPARLCLMERGVKHARVVAEIKAPPEVIERCVRSHGKVALFERTLAINEELRKWLQANVVENDPGELLVPLKEEKTKKIEACGLPTSPPETVSPVELPAGGGVLSEEDVRELVSRYNFADQERNPEGGFVNILVDNGDQLTVTDYATGLIWQRGGLDIMSHRALRLEIEQVNQQGFAGASDWRLPSMAEALSLMAAEKNQQGLFLHTCFFPEQPFVFVDAVRKPGGYWFVDFKQGRAFWSSGTIPGGFGRLCRPFQRS
ncbi:MAG: hypothetical protein CSA34_00595 [Desulfobulbus propionicus]|nr:MAG: hypothetical protein CSA34_00595 [Desulfobulbus propionicus]